MRIRARSRPNSTAPDGGGSGSICLDHWGGASRSGYGGIGLIATLIAGLSYGRFALMSHRVIRATCPVAVNAAARSRRSPASCGPPGARARDNSAALCALVGLHRADRRTGLISKTPWGVIDDLLLAGTADSAQSRLLAALGETLYITLDGMPAGLVFAFVLAILTGLSPRLTKALLPVALITQTVPLVALTPLLVRLLGRGVSLTLWATVSETFFPAFVLLTQALALVPRSIEDLPRAYGASLSRQMRMITLPASLTYVFAATRLTVPRAFSRRDDRRMAGHGQRARQPAEPIAEVPRLPDDLDRGRRVGAGVNPVLSGDHRH